MNKKTYVYLRGDVYYFRARLPGTNKEFKRSLKTKSYQIAHKRAKLYRTVIGSIRQVNDFERALNELKKSGRQVSTLTIRNLKVGNIELEDMDIDPAREGDVEAAQAIVKHAYELQNLNSSPQVTQAQTNAGKSLSDCINEYIEEKSSADSWTSKTTSENRSIFDLLLKISCSPNILASEFTHDMARTVKSKLIRLPPRINAKKDYKNKTIDEIIELGHDSISTETVNKHLVRYSSLFEYLRRHGYVKENYFSKLTIRQKKNVRTIRVPFSHEQIVKLFSHLESKERSPAQYWVPIVGLYSGMRMEEICQLFVEDIRYCYDFPCFDNNEDEDGLKRLKSSAATRVVPIHSKIIELGFLNYVEEQKKAGSKFLFPDLYERQDKDGRKSHSISRWFSEKRKEIGFHKQTPMIDFHSFRANVATELQRANISEFNVANLLGHGTGNTESWARYADYAKLETLKENIETLSYEGLEIKRTLW